MRQKFKRKQLIDRYARAVLAVIALTCGSSVPNVALAGSLAEVRARFCAELDKKISLVGTFIYAQADERRLLLSTDLAASEAEFSKIMQDWKLSIKALTAARKSLEQADIDPRSLSERSVSDLLTTWSTVCT